MKNLANCKPSEFLRQTSKIRKSASKWLADTGVLEIRKRQPQIPEGATEEEKKKALEKQARENLGLMLDAALDEHPDETLELLALLCFVEPKDVDNHEVSEYLNSFNEIISNSAVLSFFTSLMQLESMTT